MTPSAASSCCRIRLKLIDVSNAVVTIDAMGCQKQIADDDRRTRTGHGAENASRLARIALNLLKAEKTLKAGIKSKRLMCGWDHPYLLKVLTGPPKEDSDA